MSAVTAIPVHPISAPKHGFEDVRTQAIDMTALFAEQGRHNA